MTPATSTSRPSLPTRVAAPVVVVGGLLFLIGFALTPWDGWSGTADHVRRAQIADAALKGS